MEPHQLAERRSLAFHRELVNQARVNSAIVEQALGRVDEWLATGQVSKFYAEEWERLLSGSTESLFDMMTSTSEEARALRQTTPFAGALDARTRWKIWKAVRAGSEHRS